MVSFKSLITLAIAATSVSSFNLLHDDKGFAILPPTNIVLDLVRTTSLHQNLYKLVLQVYGVSKIDENYSN